MNMLKLNKVVRWEKWLVWLLLFFVCANVRVINKVTYFSAKERLRHSYYMAGILDYRLGYVSNFFECQVKM